MLNPVEIQIFRHLLGAIPEEMGVALKRSAFSPNIKERLDFSCALTGSQGEMVSQASHIPVHLGSVHVTASGIIQSCDLRRGDVIILNDPFRGGTHLPDITMFAPVFLSRARVPEMGVLCRAHHADVGGATPGSMGPSLDLHGEGVVIPPVKIVDAGVLQRDVFDFVLANSRTPEERAGDLRAQLSSVELGRRRVEELSAGQGRGKLLEATVELERHAERATRATLRELRNGTFEAADALDGPGSATIRVICTKAGSRLSVDFRATDDEVGGSYNANPAITLSAVFYVMRLLVSGDLPTNSGCLRPVDVKIREGSLLQPRRPAGVAMGNVETSQRIVDVLMQALAPCAGKRMPACSQGTMNNLTVGGRLEDGRPFTFYETLGGGAGAGPSGPGEGGVHSHMTNTMNTPIEALETSFPVLVTAYHLRRRSGGAGQHTGGEGLVREITARVRTIVTLAATRRHSGPPGARGGEAGSPGRDRVFRDGQWQSVGSSGPLILRPGDRIRIETPGGGGFGRPRRSS